jgi:hypothetical protein
MTRRTSSWDQRRLAAACLNPGATMGRHAGIQRESSAGAYSPMRNCKGPCRTRRSHTQFTGTNTMCNQCVRRTPKEVRP